MAENRAFSKLIIFDCDGVLVNSEFIASRVFAETLSTYGYSISTEECIRRFSGINEHTCRDIIMKESGMNIPIDYWKLQEPSLWKVYETELLPLMQPVLKVLNDLNISRCVASNSAKDYVMNCLEITKQMNYFSHNSIFTYEQVSQPKPAPDLFLFAAKQMGVSPENCIVVEDSRAGVEAAIAAGMDVLLFLGGNHAHFNWYHSQLAMYNKPIVRTCDELLYTIQQKI